MDEVPADWAELAGPPLVEGPVGGPAWVAWREGTLTRAKELESLAGWLARHPDSSPRSADLSRAIAHHLDAARDAAAPPGRLRLRPVKGALIERAISNLDAAEANLLQLAPPDYVIGQMPCLLNQVRRHLVADDPRRQEVERVSRRLGVADRRRSQQEQRDVIAEERGALVGAIRAAGSASLREQLRVRSFTVVVVATAVMMAFLAAGIAVLGFVAPNSVPLCFEPERQAQTVVVCPTAQTALPTAGAGGPAVADLDTALVGTTGRGDLLIVEVIGLLAAAVAAASAIRGIRGSSEPYALPVALAALKLPTGAVTAVLGLLLMRGQFVPGLTALDASAQILAWALVFGYAQQLFTRLVDQQAHTVLDRVRGAHQARSGVS